MNLSSWEACCYLRLPCAAGYLADRYSSNVVLEVGVWMWSLFTMLTPFAAHANLWTLLIVRFLTGIGEGAVLISSSAISCQSLILKPQGPFLSRIA